MSCVCKVFFGRLDKLLKKLTPSQTGMRAPHSFVQNALHFKSQNEVIYGTHAYCDLVCMYVKISKIYLLAKRDFYFYLFLLL